jgi:hypothetical protein
MRNIKHIGKMKNTGAKVLVVFRTLPGESGTALVLPTATLPDQYHDAIIQLVESEQGQDVNEFGEIMFIRHFPDGRPMLLAMQQDERLQKVPTDNVIMTPQINSAIPLDQLNSLIAEQKGIPVDELSTLVSGSPKKGNPDSKINNVNEPVSPVTEPVVEPAKAEESAVLSDKDLARSYRSQADAMYKEAAKLRKQADDLDPPQRKTAKAKEAADA